MRPTREGKRFLLSVVLIALAALNTGNNLMYLILAMMLAILAISYVLLRMNLSGLTLTVAVEQPVFAHQRANMKLKIINSKRFISSYSLRIIFPRGIHGEGYIPKVSAGGATREETDVTFRKRGVYAYGDFVIESSFPFIFFTKRMTVRVSGEAIVYPEIKEVDVAYTFTGGDEEAWTMRPGQGEELLTIREFRAGDDRKYVHWKASAKSEKLMVREYSEEEPQLISIILEDIGPSAPVSFERAVSYAASVAWTLVNDGYYVRLMTCNKLLPFGTGIEHLYKLLDILAALQESGSAECPAVRDELKGGSLLILKTRNTALRELIPLCDVVVYATGL